MRDKLIENFLRISKIPRGSGNEKMISDFFVDVAKKNNLYYFQDEYYNVLIKKKGNIPGDTLAFQAHLDMVCKKRKGSLHNFETDGIDVIIDGDKVFAKDTTLGADQGVGLTFMLTMIEDNNLVHPDLEFLFTVQEETTFNGAINFPYDKVESRKLINLDNDRDDNFIIASAGDILNTYTYSSSLTKKDLPSYKITIDTTPGGNSGVYIKESEFNAIATMAKLLNNKDIYIKSINGGTFENDLATHCEAIIQTDLDINVFNNYRIEKIDNDNSFSKEDTNNIINEILLLKSGYLSNISSCNLGMIETNDNIVKITYLIRSFDNLELNNISLKTKEINNFKCNELYRDSIWKLNKNSELSNKYKKLYYDIYHEYPKEGVIQGGIELTCIQNKIDNLDVLCIGATMENIHTPNEISYISSWEKIYDLLIKFIA